MQPMRRIGLLLALPVFVVTAAAVMSEASPQGSATKGPAPLYVTTFVDLMPQNKEPGTVAIRNYVMATRREPGMVRVEAIAQVGGRDNHLMIYEVWKNQKAFEEHEASANTREFRSKLLPLLGAPFDQRLYFLVE